MTYQVNIKFFLMVIALMIMPVLISIPIYQTELSHVKHQLLDRFQQQISQDMQAAIEEKQHDNLVLATTLSNWQDLRQFIRQPASYKDFKAKLAHLAENLKSTTKYKNVWVQLLDAKGTSQLRSWTEKRGDSLVAARKDIAQMVQNPRIRTSISVGKFALSIKAIVPIFEKERFVGMVEIITRLNSIDYDVRQKYQSQTAVLIHKKYRNQLRSVSLSQLMAGHVLTNTGTDNKGMVAFGQGNFDHFLKSENYLVHKNNFTFSFPIRDNSGEVLGFWLFEKNLLNFDWNEIEHLKVRYLTVVLFIMVLMVLLSTLVFLIRKSNYERQYFYQIFNHASEVVFITNREKILDANLAFFNLFSEFDTIEAFHEKHHCVCELFVRQEGYLSDYVEGHYWLEYLIHHTDEKHLAIVQRPRGNRIFYVQASKIITSDGGHAISVIMQDVTEEEHYKEELRHLTIKDDLTGLFNRYHFNQVLEAEIHRAHRYHLHLSMITFDIDFFKSINDTFGHDVGDKVLKQVAAVIEDYIRETDVLCRVGGEEFMIIMPETTIAQAGSMADRLRVNVEAMTTPDEMDQAITISLGVVELTQRETAMIFYKRADEALYRAKDNGRNCVVIDN